MIPNQLKLRFSLRIMDSSGAPAEVILIGSNSVALIQASTSYLCELFY